MILSIARRARSPRRGKGSLLLTALALLVLSLAIVVGWIARGWSASNRPPSAFDGFLRIRMKTVQAQLDQVQGPYLVILGDSHAERLFTPTLCGLPLVNGGISGATLADVLDLSRKITPPRRAEAVLLMVGTNDIWVKRNPETKAAEDNFQAGLAALKQRLAAWSSRRALISIPPVTDKERTHFPRSAAARYSSMLAESCDPERCRYFDLFEEAQDRPGRRSAFVDGVHLRDYADFVRKQEGELCSGLGLPTQK